MDKQGKRIEVYVLKTVEQTIKEYSMLQEEDNVLVGVSGGPDSIALLHVLSKISPKFSFRLGIAHLNHGIRGKDSDKDAAFVLSFAKHLNIPCYIEAADVQRYRRNHKLSLEQAARRVRYDFFHRLSKIYQFNKIALGHHLDDNTEMILMALFRGSGPLGLSGIPPIRDNKIVRPLIRLTKSEIKEYLNASQLKFVIDRTNQDIRYLRNRIRHQLIPLLKDQYNPKISESLNRLAGIIRSEENWVKQFINPLYGSSVLKSGDMELTLFIPHLKCNHPAAKRRIVRMAIERVKGNLKRITFNHVDMIIRLMESGPGWGRLDLPDRILVRRNADRMVFSKENRSLRMIKTGFLPIEPHDFSYEVVKPETVNVLEINAAVSFSEIDIKKIQDICFAGQRVAFFDIKKVKYPLILRNFRRGDRFSPLGMTGTQTVKKFLMNRKMPRDERYNCPVLMDKEKILWVVGHRIDESVKVTSSTQKVLKAEIRPCLKREDD